MKKLYSLFTLLLLGQMVFSQKWQNDEDWHLHGGITLNRFHGLNSNLQAAVYSYGFANMADPNVFNLRFQPVTLGVTFGVSLPISDRWDYEVYLVRSSAKATIEYSNISGGEEMRSIKFRTTEINILSFKYNFSEQHGISLSLPYTVGKLLYKSEGIAAENDYQNYEVISVKNFLAHFSAIDLGLGYQLNLTKFLSFRYDFRLPLVSDKVITTGSSRFTLQSNRSVFSIMYRY
jgi:hypothetical protein